MAKPKQTKKAATWSLVIMGAGFAATLPFQHIPGVRLVTGAFEAGMVGGLADWFAVTALFRHPLGIPIPHTALLPKNREKLTDALVNTVENNLLNKESISSKIHGARLAELVVNALEKGLETPQASKTIDHIAKRLVEHIPLEGLVPVLTAEIRHQVTAMDTRPILEQLAKGIVDKSYDSKALDYALGQAESWLMKPDSQYMLGSMGMQAIAGLQLNGLMQFAVNAFMGYLNEERMGEMIRHFLLERIDELRMQSHPRREAVLRAMKEQVRRLATDGTLHEGLNDWKADWAASWQGEELIHAKLEELRTRLLTGMEDGAYVERHLLPVVRRMIDYVRQEQGLLDKLNSQAVDLVTGLLEANHGKIGKLVRENVDKMDNDTLIALMEDKLGQDIQWIRINGALTGFLIGIVLTGIRMVLE
ncbi:DUF445 domain-containing protein [Paenibacillus massiliensis]|uniref:DUF445 domain-containing protein n=1 Tax=Paenibacillus massiliensis TaxID=225917 RepID=UPI0004722F45|nr:DUF445 domain-containing protein [Paenibacillus massiliensis]